MESDKKLEKLLVYLDNNYALEKVYYPGSGWHKVPKETLGTDKVVHVSLEENLKWVDGGYFRRLGKGLNVKGDYRKSPFQDKTFDATLIWGIPPVTAIDAVPEFRRVTKKNGLLIVGSNQFCSTESVYNSRKITFDDVLGCVDGQLTQIKIPSCYFGISVYKNE